jgi:hypothetical protein
MFPSLAVFPILAIKTFIWVMLSTNFYTELVVIDAAEFGSGNINTHEQSSQSIY